MKNKVTTGIIISDCDNAIDVVRQQAYFKDLFGVLPSLVGVNGEAPDLVAAGHLVDALDVLQNFPLTKHKSGRVVVLVNSAPRGGTSLVADNGTPFCYFELGNILVVSTLEGECLSLVKKLGIVTEVQAVDTRKVTAAAVEWGDLTHEQAHRINNSQFRSLEFLQPLAYWVLQGRPLPSRTVKLADGPRANNYVWCVDGFGNAKTTLTANEVDFEPGKKLTISDGKTATCYTRLTDVPNNESGVTIGSSGYGDKRFLEIVVQWRDGGYAASDSGAKRHKLKAGLQALNADLLQLQKGKS